MIRVTCAIIRDDDDKVLVVQRGENTDHPFRWEFPGGKVEEGETDEESVLREIREELSMDIVICSKMAGVEYDYGHKKIVLVPFVCDTLDELPILSEHIAFKWIKSGDLKNVDFSEADIIAASNYIKEIAGQASEAESIRMQKFNESEEDDFILMISNIRGVKEVEWLVDSAKNNPEIFRKILGYSFSPDKKLAFHASWALTKACDNNPDIIYPYMDEIVESLDKVEHESVIRSILRSVALCDMTILSIKNHGLLADNCFRILRSGFSAIALKVYSMDIIYKLALIYPDLANELSATIVLLQGEGSAGIIARARMILKKLAAISE